MFKITKREKIMSVAKSWAHQYSPIKSRADDKTEIYRKLTDLDLTTATEDDVEEVIGNRSWTRMKCDQCRKEVDTLIVVGAPSDYESHTAELCPECISAAFDLANGQISNPH